MEENKNKEWIENISSYKDRRKEPVNSSLWENA
jgi:hypothetical protein